MPNRMKGNTEMLKNDNNNEFRLMFFSVSYK